MSDLRAAAQQALEALNYYERHTGFKSTATDALRAALAQQPEPVQEPVHQFRLMYSSDWHDGHPNPAYGYGPYQTRTLYAAPPQRPRLTDEEIDKATAQERDALLDHIYEYGTAAEGVLERIRRLARAVERKVRGE
jgi:hypothetical protein